MGVSSKQANHMNNRTSHVIADSDGYPRLYMLKLNRANTVADTGGLQWFQLKPPLKERAPLIRDDWYREEQKSP